MTPCNSTDNPITGRTMSIAYASDLHFEFHRHNPHWMPDLPENPDVLILAGDIDVGDEVIDSVQRISESLPNTQIIFIAGNHEFYAHHHQVQVERYREAFTNNTKVHFLEQGTIEIYGMTFLGCTLWTGFDVLPEHSIEKSMAVAHRAIGDFEWIGVSGQKNSYLRASPEYLREQYLHSRAWLGKAFATADPQSTVVVTHFPPHSRCLHGRIPTDILTNYFVANCDDLIEEFQPTAWIYGHNHWSDRFKVGQTIVTSNQLGYPQEEGLMPAFHYNMLEVPTNASH